MRLFITARGSCSCLQIGAFLFHSNTLWAPICIHGHLHALYLTLRVNSGGFPIRLKAIGVHAPTTTTLRTGTIPIILIGQRPRLYCTIRNGVFTAGGFLISVSAIRYLLVNTYRTPYFTLLLKGPRSPFISKVK